MGCDHLKALDLAKAGQWDTAHELVQPFYDRKSCLIHGYLHRVEGDTSNARYWYRKAGEAMPSNSLEEELARLFTIVKGQG